MSLLIKTTKRWMYSSVYFKIHPLTRKKRSNPQRSNTMKVRTRNISRAVKLHLPCGHSFVPRNVNFDFHSSAAHRIEDIEESSRKWSFAELESQWPNLSVYGYRKIPLTSTLIFNIFLEKEKGKLEKAWEKNLGVLFLE